MFQSVFRRNPRALGVSANHGFFNTQRIHERFELIDPALHAFARRIVGIGLTKTADAVERINLKFCCQRRHQLSETGFA